MAARNRIVLGSRGSELALSQARIVEAALRKAWPQLEVMIEIVRTSGDERGHSAAIVDRKAGRKGMFTREIEKELLLRRVDVAVHSAKDLPSEQLDELEIASTLPRANTEDALVTRQGFGLTSLPRGATVGTGSIRRQRQLKWKRADLKVVDLRGNVPTRLRKFRENSDWSGIILARAGLERLGIVSQTLGLREAGNELERHDAGHIQGLDCNYSFLSADDFLPAGGQGIIALQVRREDQRAEELLAPIDDWPTHLCLRAEREFLRLLNGDCDSPVGVQARWWPNELELRAQVFAVEEVAPHVDTVRGSAHEPEIVAKALMKKMYGG